MAERSGARDDGLVVSGSSRIRTAGPLNHRLYADHLGVPYLFDLAPSTVDRIYFHKIDVVRRVLPLAEWVFWIDDDAFFTNFDIDLFRFLDDARDADLIFCQSPVNPRGGWTWMSSGQFFVRRSEATLQLLRDVAETDLETVRAWWDPDAYGLFTNGDQDAFVYQLLGPTAERWRGRFVRLPWMAFNSRPYHYKERLDEHFVCHFAVPGGVPKADLIAEFATRLQTTQALCDPGRIEPYRVFLERSEIGAFVGIRSHDPAGTGEGAAARSAAGPTGGAQTAAYPATLPPRRLGPGVLRRLLRRPARVARRLARRILR